MLNVMPDIVRSETSHHIFFECHPEIHITIARGVRRKPTLCRNEYPGHITPVRNISSKINSFNFGQVETVKTCLDPSMQTQYDIMNCTCNDPKNSISVIHNSKMRALIYASRPPTPAIR